MYMEIVFEFEIGEAVKISAIDKVGVVTSACFDGSNKYYVDGLGDGISGWYPEIALESVA